MFAPEFDYYKASSVSEAIQLLGSHDGAKLIAGGHSLIPLLKLRLTRPTALIDIGGIADLKGITVNNGTVRIGALATHWDIASSHDVNDACSMLAEVAGGIGDPHVRNRGTIGGNVVHADPASDWPAVLTALNARFLIQGPGESARTASPSEFFGTPFEPNLFPNEVLTAVEVPSLAANQRTEYAKVAHPASSYAVVGGAVVVTMDGDRCTAASIALGGLVPAPVRASSVERALIGQTLSVENIMAACDQVANDLGEDVIGDIYASAEYRRAMAAVEIRHALFHITGQAHHGSRAEMSVPPSNV
ncbi:MAG: xanthine dehydrogenase family protein subunit M [Chloroflexi bacterium]|nr:xanthine dehydrogenase family protein subunit M [Chloroflexota bacterium]